MYLGSYDFLIQTKEESPSDGIHIYYKFCHDNWHRLDPGPGGKADGKMSEKNGITTTRGCDGM